MYGAAQIAFFFNDTATTEIYTLSLHDALPISVVTNSGNAAREKIATMIQQDLSQVGIKVNVVTLDFHSDLREIDRKSTRLNSSHSQISYAVFCLKKNSSDSRLTVGNRAKDLLV